MGEHTSVRIRNINSILRQRGACRGAGWHWGRCRAPRPDQHGPVLVHRQPFGLDDFGLQVVEVVLIQGEAALAPPLSWQRCCAGTYRAVGLETDVSRP